jgi:hypothetical protein
VVTPQSKLNRAHVLEHEVRTTARCGATSAAGGWSGAGRTVESRASCRAPNLDTVVLYSIAENTPVASPAAFNMTTVPPGASAPTAPRRR